MSMILFCWIPFYSNWVQGNLHPRIERESLPSFPSPEASIPLVIRGPYLQMGAPNRMTVRWRTDVYTDSKVWYGTDLANLNLLASVDGT